jgi:hypothetical protein
LVAKRITSEVEIENSYPLEASLELVPDCFSNLVQGGQHLDEKDKKVAHP